MTACERAVAPKAALRRAYRLMAARHGHQGWWPGETPFEICVGAILTQNTNWTNVERAIARLRQAGALELAAMHRLAEADLAALIRPAGYFNVKARRLRAFTAAVIERFDSSLHEFLRGTTPAVRRRLLAIKGIGPETADCILLYAGSHLSFVVDAYTRRIFERHGWCRAGVSYDQLQTLCQGALRHGPRDSRLDYWRDFHAQLVRIGKEFCRPRAPACAACPLVELLPDAAPGRVRSRAISLASPIHQPVDFGDVPGRARSSIG